MVTHGIAAIHRDNVVTVRLDATVVDLLTGVCRLMVKIRYSELPAGLHVAATADRDCTVVYLQPGLSPAQRRAALFRVRSSARIGEGPALPRPAMARAIAADRVRTSAHVGAAATRRHPMLFLPPVIMLAGALVFMFVPVRSLPVGNPSRVGASAPALVPGSGAIRPGNLPTTQAPGSSQPGNIQPATGRPACGPRLPSSAKLRWLTRPSRSQLQAPATKRCTRPQSLGRWLAAP